MAWPTVVVDTTHLDSATDSPGNARADIKQMADNVNAIKDSRNAANGIAPLDAGGLLPTGNLPTVPANKGGTGQAGFVVGDILVANSTTTLSKLSPGANGMVLKSNGPGALPSYSTVSAPIASQAEAEAGTDNTKMMTPLRTKQAIDALASGALIDFQIYDASGTYDKTVNNPSFVIVEMIGGGGAGGGRASTAGSAAGGGAGGYCRKKILNSAMSNTTTVTVGSGGAAGTGAGGNGGTSSFGAICSATGGVGGQAGAGSTKNLGGAGGAGLGGDLNLTGATGGDNFYISSTSSYSGCGASSIFAGGGQSRGVASSSDNFAGGAGPANTGSGGSGAARGSVSNSNGGAGGSGLVIVWEYK
jgi:hypothetical protein